MMHWLRKKFKPELIKIDGMSFLWFIWLNGKYYALYYENNPPIWKLPRIEIGKYSWRIGWLTYAIGICKYGDMVKDLD